MATSVDTSIERRLDQVESRFAIEELLAAYAHGFDREDPDLLRTIWHEDAAFDLGDPFGSYTGIDSIIAAAEGFWGQMPWMNHWMATPSIKIDGDTATASMGVDCMVEDKDQGPVAIGGTYEDRFERRDGVWKFSGRKFIIHYFTPVKDWKPSFGKVVD